MGKLQGYVNVKAYKEFDGENRPYGWNAWLTFAISQAVPTSSPHRNERYNAACDSPVVSCDRNQDASSAEATRGLERRIAPPGLRLRQAFYLVSATLVAV